LGGLEDHEAALLRKANIEPCPAAVVTRRARMRCQPQRFSTVPKRRLEV
jgi:hypothetical protein